MKNKKISKAVMIAVGLVLVCIIGILGFGYYKFNQINKVNISKDNIDLGITPGVEDNINNNFNKNSDRVRNILFLGVDNEEDASDSIIVVSIDQNDKKIKMTSIMRDSYVDFKGETVKKINYAYHYGGPQFAIKTVNENYDLNIKDYVKVDFVGLMNVIDALGGVEINIKNYEVPVMKLYGIKTSGKHILNGKQALGYSRIRKVGDYDYERTQRQRDVLTSLFSKVKKIGATEATSLVGKILPNIETSMSSLDIMELVKNGISMGGVNIDELRLPLDDYKKSVIENKLFYLKWEKQPNVDALHKFIYGDSQRKIGLEP